MKKIFLSLALAIGLAFILGGCEDNECIVCSDHTPPAVPKGFYSITGNEVVYLRWEENDESDFREYRVYRCLDGENYYHRIATAKIAKFNDYTVTNGVTYHFAVSAVDKNGNESNLSKDVYDTPRPEGDNWTLYDRFYKPSLSGFDFSDPEVLDWEDADADVYLEYDGYVDAFFLCAADTLTDIQDFGYTDNLTDVTWSPFEGWSKVGWVEVIEGHSYIIWTWDDHYATLRVEKISGDTKITFDWAYQTDPANPELAPRPPHAENYLKEATREVSAK
jgi:hypothetical protein